MPIDPREWSDPFGGADVGVGLLALAASFGGRKAFSRVLAGLRNDFSVPIVLVQHIRPDRPSRLAEILARSTQLSVKQAEEGEALRSEIVYTPAPDRHMSVGRDGTLSLLCTPRVQFVRPSEDVLFASVADSFGDRPIAVVLTGSRCGGSEGVRDVRRRGGFVIAQDGKTSECPAMPQAAVETRKVDLVLPLNHIAFALDLEALVSQEPTGTSRQRHRLSASHSGCARAGYEPEAPASECPRGNALAGASGSYPDAGACATHSFGAPANAPIHELSTCSCIRTSREGDSLSASNDRKALKRVCDRGGRTQRTPGMMAGSVTRTGR